MKKLDAEPRLQGAVASVVEWARKVAQAVNMLVEGVTSLTSSLAGFSVARSGTNGTAATIAPVNGGNGDASLNLNKVGAAQAAGITGKRAGVFRWSIALGDSSAESGANAGSDFSIARYSDAGASLATAFSIRRSDGLVSCAGNLLVTGAGTFNGTMISDNGALTTSRYNTSGTIVFNNVLNTAPAGFTNTLSSQHNPGVFAKWQFQVGGVNFDFKNDGHATCVAWDSTSDRRVKKNIEPVADALQKVALLTAYTFERTDVVDEFAATPKRQAGLIAQDVQAALPEAVSVAPDDIGTLSYEAAAVVGLVAQAVNELHALHTQEVSDLRGSVAALRAELDVLKGA
jgi:hypothetical protein